MGSSPYLAPPGAVADALDERSRRSLEASPPGHHVLVLSYAAYIPARVQASLKLMAGAQPIDAVAGVTQPRELLDGVSILDWQTGHVWASTSEGPLQAAVWSPDGTTVAVTEMQEDGLRLRFLEADGERAIDARVPIFGAAGWGMSGPRHGLDPEAFAWAQDASHVVARARSGIYEASPVESGPRTFDARHQVRHRRWQLDARVASAKQFSDLFRSKLVRIYRDGRVEWLEEEDLFLSVTASPDNRFLLTRRLSSDYDPSFPFFEACTPCEVRDEAGNVVAVVGDGGNRQIRRAIGWHDGLPASLTWLEQRRGADHLVLFDVASQHARVVPVPGKIAAVCWFEQPLGQALVWHTTGETYRLSVISADDPANCRELERWSAADRYGPGVAVTTGPGGTGLLRDFDGRFLLKANRGTHWELNAFRPDHSKKTLLTYAHDQEERLLFVGPSGAASRVLIERGVDDRIDLIEVGPHQEKRTTRHSLKRPSAAYRRVTADRGDLSFTAKAALPDANADAPLLVWVYPKRYENAAAVELRQSKDCLSQSVEFPDPSVLCRAGVAVVSAAVPVVSDSRLPGDWLDQLARGVRAMVTTIADSSTPTRRIYVGGHSYGAAAAALVLTQLPEARGAVCVNGVYNRTLTPFGFQDERRTLWDDPALYAEHSALLQLGTLRRSSFLLIHGERDEGPGTEPLQSQRMFEALQGLGHDCRLVLLPDEGHAIRSRRGVFHAVAEIVRFLEVSR